MAMSFLCSLGPVWYHPTILSLAGKETISGFELLHEDLCNSLKRIRTPVVMLSTFFKIEDIYLNNDVLLKSKTQKQSSQKISGKGSPETSIS